MPVTSNTWTYGGFPCVDPRSLLEAGNRSQISQAFLGKANSYRCPQGRAWGTGYVLLYGRDVATMFAESKKAPRSLVISLQKNGEARTQDNVATTLTIQSLFCLRAINLTPMLGAGNKYPWQDRKETQPSYAVNRFWHNSRPINPDAVYMLELVDRRYFLARFTAINKNYNVANPLHKFQGRLDTIGDAGYYEDSLNAGVRWTAQEVLNDIWTIMGTNLTGGSLTYAPNTGFPTTLTAKYVPYNFRFAAVNAWEAFHDALESICLGTNSSNWVLVYDPVQDSFKVTKDQGVTETELSSDDTLKYLELQRIYDAEVIDTGIGIIAKKRRVYNIRKYDEGTSPNFDVKSGASWSYPVNVFGTTEDDEVYDTESITTPIVNLGGIDAVDDTISFFVAGTVDGIYDGTETGETVLSHTENAATRPENNIHTRVYSGRYGFMLLRGIATTELNAIILPKTLIRQAVWRDYGDEFGLCTEFHNYEGDFPPATPRDTQSFSSREMHGGSGQGLYLPSGYGNQLNNYSAGTPNSRHFSPDFNRYDWQNQVPETAIIRSIRAYPIDYPTLYPDDQLRVLNIAGTAVVSTTTYFLGVIIRPDRQFNTDPQYYGPKCYIRARRGWSYAVDTGVDLLSKIDLLPATFVPANREFVGRLVGVASDNVPIYEVPVYAEIFELELLEELDRNTTPAKAILRDTSGGAGTDGQYVYVMGEYMPEYPTVTGAASAGTAHTHPIATPYPRPVGSTVLAMMNYQTMDSASDRTYLYAIAFID